MGARTINKWEARQADITPLPYMQEVLDTALAQASDEAKARFADGAQVEGCDELTITKQRPVASQPESSQEDDPATVERLGDGQAEISACDGSHLPDERVDDPSRDLVLSASWDQWDAVKASVALSGVGPVRRRRFA
ncbi:MAG TPA: hypothetical protein VFO16_24490, partial [Pseudonocardiaceae bacterium]|nr:hypothetical protein [Pseudonocardiaceae bacterium]